jgi:hypothetical protein
MKNLKISKKILSFILAFFLLHNPIIHAWQPSLNNTKERLDFLRGLDSAFGKKLLSNNISYKRNFLKTLEDMVEVHKQLGPEAYSLDINNVEQNSIEYWESLGTHDPAAKKALEEIKIQLLNDIKKLADTGILNPQENPRTLKGDLETIKKFSKEDKIFKQNTSAYLRLLPLLSKVNDLGGLNQFIENLNPLTLEDLYHLDPIRKLKSQIQELAKTPGLGSIDDQFIKFEREFINKAIQNATKVTTVDGQKIAPKSLILEEIPPSITPFRGCMGGDCSIASVPFYGLVKGVQIYWIKEGEKFIGYTVIAQATDSEGNKIPYVVTINGPAIHTQKVKKVLELIAVKENVQFLALPDFSENRALVNNDMLKEAMTSSDPKNAILTLPTGMKKVSTFQDAQNTGYTNYYKPEDISKAIIASLTSLDTHPETTRRVVKSIRVQSGFLPPKADAEMEFLERCIFAARTLDAASTKNSDLEEESQRRGEVLRALKVTEEQYEATRILLSLDPLKGPYRIEHKPLDEIRYQKINKELGLSLAQILPYLKIPSGYFIGDEQYADPDLDKVSLIGLKNSPIVSEEEWNRLIRPLYDEDISNLRNKILSANLASNTHSIIDLSMSLMGFLNQPSIENYLGEVTKLAGQLAKINPDFMYSSNGFGTEVFLKIKEQLFNGEKEPPPSLHLLWQELSVVAGLTKELPDTEEKQMAFLEGLLGKLNKSMPEYYQYAYQSIKNKRQSIFALASWIGHVGSPKLKALAHKIYISNYCFLDSNPTLWEKKPDENEMKNFTLEFKNLGDTIFKSTEENISDLKKFLKSLKSENCFKQFSQDVQVICDVKNQKDLECLPEGSALPNPSGNGVNEVIDQLNKTPKAH